MIYGGDHAGELDDLEKSVRRTTKALRAHADEFDFIAVCVFTRSLMNWRVRPDETTGGPRWPWDGSPDYIGLFSYADDFWLDHRCPVKIP